MKLYGITVPGARLGCRLRHISATSAMCGADPARTSIDPLLSIDRTCAIAIACKMFRTEAT